MKYIAKKFRELRKEKGYSQQEVADLVGFSASTLSRIENNPSDSKTIHLKQLAEFYDVSLEKIFSQREYKMQEKLQRITVQILGPDEICSSKFFFEVAQIILKKEQKLQK